MNEKKHIILLRLLGGGIFAVGIFLFILPSLGKLVTIGVILAFAGSSLVIKVS